MKRAPELEGRVSLLPRLRRARRLVLLATVAILAGCRVSDPRERPDAATARFAGTRSPRPRADSGLTALRFEDITAASGVRFKHDRASSGRKYFVETMGGGVAVIDYDNDGLQDLFFLNGAPLPGYRPSGPMLPALYRNLGERRFREVTRAAGLAVGMYGMGCAVGDYDNDGFDDLYLTAVLGPSRLFRNQGDGTFRDVTAAAGVDDGKRFAASAAWLDYDRDGDLDLYVCNYVVYNSVADDLPCFFKENVRSYCIPFAYQAEPNCLYRNEGNGRFTDVSRGAQGDARPGKSLAVAVVDVDHDGWPDILVANDTTPSQLFRNNRDGTFSEIAPAQAVALGPSGAAKAGMGVDVADDRNNGQWSVAIGNFSSEMVAYYQQVGAYFEERSIAVGLGHPSRSFLTFGTLFLDWDNDGWKDLFLANGHVQDNVGLFHSDLSYELRPLLYRNMGGARYEEVAERAGLPMTAPIVARAAARVDLDNDGRLDLVVTRNNGPAHLWRNAVEPRRRWLMVRLRGVKSNRNGYGSRVLITTREGRQMAEAQSAASYLTANDQRLHFGLGDAPHVERLEVRWPSGTIDVLSGLAADQKVTVTEGQSGARG